MVEEQKLSPAAIFNYEDDELAFRSPMPLHISNPTRSASLPSSFRIGSNGSAFSVPDFGTYSFHDQPSRVDPTVENHIFAQNSAFFGSTRNSQHPFDIGDALHYNTLSQCGLPPTENSLPSPSRTVYRAANTTRLYYSRTPEQLLGEGIAHRPDGLIPSFVGINKIPDSNFPNSSTPKSVDPQFLFSHMRHASPRPGPSYMIPSSHVTSSSSPEFRRPIPKRSCMENTLTQLSSIGGLRNAPYVFPSDQFTSKNPISVTPLESQDQLNRQNDSQPCHSVTEPSSRDAVSAIETSDEGNLSNNLQPGQSRNPPLISILEMLGTNSGNKLTVDRDNVEKISQCSQDACKQISPDDNGVSEIDVQDLVMGSAEQTESKEQDSTEDSCGNGQQTKHISIFDWHLICLPIQPKPNHLLPPGVDRWIVIEGVIKKGRQHFQWHTSLIVDRVSRMLLKTLSGKTYKLEGELMIDSMMNYGFSQKCCEKFRDGFPDDWKEILLCEFSGGLNLSSTKPPEEAVHGDVDGPTTIANGEKTGSITVTNDEANDMITVTRDTENDPTTVGHDDELKVAEDLNPEGYNDECHAENIDSGGKTREEMMDTSEASESTICVQPNRSDRDGVDRNTDLHEFVDPIIVIDSILDGSIDDTQNVLDIQDTQNVLDIQDTQNVLDIQDTQNVLDIRDAQDAQEAQDVQEIRDMQDIQNMKDIIDYQEIRDVQEIRDIQDAQVGNKKFGKKKKKELKHSLNNISKRGSKVVAITSSGRQVRRPGSWWAVNPEPNEELGETTSKKRKSTGTRRESKRNLISNASMLTGKRQRNENFV
ncbi:18841_t:CDS:1 [Acaulospora morrowiae]|uniref:18841_t:CDS:1 n=1 Tax=Acaulospora morrowiae TaxID=94023 RepID=A0A9N8W304_9GLOM|nr:18841_t:CDS:1 [Acaulospora morrowiae]